MWKKVRWILFYSFVGIGAYFCWLANDIGGVSFTSKDRTATHEIGSVALNDYMDLYGPGGPLSGTRGSADIYDSYQEAKKKKSLYWMIAIGCFFVSIVLAWSNRYTPVKR